MIGQCVSALAEDSEPLRQFAEDILFRIQLGKLGYDTRRSQTLGFFVPGGQSFLVLVASNTRSWNQTWKRVVNIQYGSNSVSGRIWETVCCISNMFIGTRVFPKILLRRVQWEKRSVGIDHSESTYSTTTQRLQLNSDIRYCRS